MDHRRLKPTLRIEGIDSIDVIGNHTVPVGSVEEHGVSVLGCLGVGARKSVTILPEHIACNASGVESCLLPGVLDRAVVSAAVLLQQARLSSSNTARAVGSYPQVTPAVCLAPCECVLAMLTALYAENYLQLSGYRWNVAKSSDVMLMLSAQT